MTHPLLADPFIAAEIEQALEPYASLLEPDELAWARVRLAAMLEEEPDARGRLDAAYPRTVERSGEQLRPSASLGGGESAAEPGAQGGGAGGATR